MKHAPVNLERLQLRGVLDFVQLLRRAPLVLSRAQLRLESLAGFAQRRFVSIAQRLQLCLPLGFVLLERLRATHLLLLEVARALLRHAALQLLQLRPLLLHQLGATALEQRLLLAQAL